MWTKEDLQQLVRREIGDYRLIVVSNRQPYIHKLVDGKVKYVVPAGGLINAIDPLMQACGGTWVAHGGGTGDRLVVEEGNKVMVPPDDPSYTLRLVWLTEEQEQGYYYGFSNESLWPLCHNAYTEPIFNYQDWEIYKSVNQIFADQVLDEIAGQPAVVFTQDYHLALLPRFIRAADPDVITGQFWHIPWPNPDIFRICPWQDEILDGLLGNDLLGFHIGEHSNNFMSTVARALDARVDSEYNLIHYSGETTLVRPFPISVDFEEICQEAQSDEVAVEIERLIDELDLGDKLVGLGIDRIDYTKGIPHRLKAFGRFLEKYPEYRGRAVFVQAGVISRSEVDAYRKLSEQIEELVDQINGRFAKGGWQPIIYMPTDLPSVTLLALRMLSRFCVVSSLHDGMNLVAKEYVASRFDEDGVLILSPFTGAAHELTQALIVNPYATEEFADAILRAVTMPRPERRFRMLQMRYTVRENNIYKWAAQLLVQLLQGIRPSRATGREAYLTSPTS
jgi:alpha,alpha-trehalose-phosphate synthase [UDP-forming]